MKGTEPARRYNGRDEAEQIVAVMMPTTILGTPTAKRSLKADEKQNLPYCRHMP